MWNGHSANPDLKLRALAVQLIESNDAVILKRGATEFRVAGPGAKEILQAIMLMVADDGATTDEICATFPLHYQDSVRELIRELEARRILVAAADPSHSRAISPEDPLDILYWHFGYTKAEVNTRLQSRPIIIVGVNWISRQMLAGFAAAQVTNIQVVDFPLLRDVRFFDDAGAINAQAWPTEHAQPVPYTEWPGLQSAAPPVCLVATSDFGGLHLMREWNQYCVEERVHFLPVVLQNLIGYVGPLVIPGETACFECMRARQNSQLSDPKLARAAEQEAFGGQTVSAFHPSMASILGDIAVLELTKLYGQVPRWRVGTLIEVSLLAPSLIARKVLKIPRCPVCSPLHQRSSVSFDSVTYLPPNELASVE